MISFLPQYQPPLHSMSRNVFFVSLALLAGALVTLSVIAAQRRQRTLLSFGDVATPLKFQQLKWTNTPGMSFQDFVEHCQNVKSQPWYDNIQDPATLADKCSGQALSDQYMAYMRKEYPDYYHPTQYQTYLDKAKGYV